MLGLSGSTITITTDVCEYIMSLIVLTDLVMMTIQAERTGTARAERIPISSYLPVLASAGPGEGKRAGGRERINTPERRTAATKQRHTPQWSRSRQQDNTIVKAGAEKKMAVQSPKGRRATASKIARRRRPPSTPCAAILHLVAKSGVPSGL